jgi:hypothetical protein
MEPRVAVSPRWAARSAGSDKRYVFPPALLILVLIAPGAFAQHVAEPFARAAQHINTAFYEILPTADVGDCVCNVDCIFMIVASANAVLLPRGGTVTDIVNISCLQSNGPLALSVAGLPAGISVSFDTNPTAGSVVLTLSAANTAPLGHFTFTIVAASGTSSASTSIAVTIIDGNPVHAGTCHIGYDIVSEWDGMFEAVLSIDNTGTMPIPPGWRLTWSFANGQSVFQLWNGTAMQTAANVTVQGDANIPVGGSDKGVGFLGMRLLNVPNQVPNTFSLNGAPCSVN